MEAILFAVRDSLQRNMINLGPFQDFSLREIKTAQSFEDSINCSLKFDFLYRNSPCTCPTCLSSAAEPLGNIKKAWAKAKAKAGITKKARLHDIRHTAATRILKESKDITKVQAALGHADLRSTERYEKVDFEELRAAMERMNSKH